MPLRLPIPFRASALLALAAVLSPSASQAREAPPASAPELDRMAARLADPGTQLAVSAALVAMSEALLEMRVEPFARAAREAGAGDRIGELPRDARLRDLAGPRAGDVQQDIAREVPRAMGRAAAMAGALQGMLPELAAMARRMRQALPSAVD